MWNIKNIFGDSWKTSFWGVIAGAMIIVQDFIEKGETNGYKIALGVAVFLLGRFASDNKPQ